MALWAAAALGALGARCDSGDSDQATPDAAAVGTGGAIGSSAGGTGGSGGTGARAGSGATATSGSGGTSSGTDANVAAEYAWLFDADVWRVVPIPDSTCELFQGDVSKLRFPGHDWQPCGPGCLKAEACPGPAPYWAPTVGAAVRTLNGTVFLSLSFGVLTGDPGVKVAGIWELESGRPRVVLQTRKVECSVRLASPDSPFLFELVRNKDPFKLWPGLASIDSGTVTWGVPPLETGMWAFDFVTGWGAEFAFAKVAYTTDPATTALSVIYTGDYVRHPATAGDEIFVPEWTSAGGVIWAWTPSSGMRAIAQGDWLPHVAAASTRTVAWLGVHGAQAFEGTFERSEIYWTARGSDGAGALIEVIPGAGVPGPPVGFFTGGAFVAWDGCWGGCRIHVADLAAKRLVSTFRSHWTVPRWSLETAEHAGTGVSDHPPMCIVLHERVAHDLQDLVLESESCRSRASGA